MSETTKEELQKMMDNAITRRLNELGITNPEEIEQFKKWKEEKKQLEKKAKEKEALKIIGTCTACGTKITEKDTNKAGCPACGGSSYTTPD